MKGDNGYTYEKYDKNILYNIYIVKMQNIFKTLDAGYIVYNNQQIIIIIDFNDVLWINARQTAMTLNYVDPKRAIVMNVPKKDKTQLKFIRWNKDSDKGHPNTIYLTEAGLYRLIFRSKLPTAEKFVDWVTRIVLPSIRKYGWYKVNEYYKQKEKKLNTKIKRLTTMKRNADLENQKLRQNLKKNKFPTGGLFYAIDFSTPTTEIFRIGMTYNMKKRKQVIDTHTLNRHKVAFYIETQCAHQLESCIRAFLYDYRYKDNKDFYLCSLKRIKFIVRTCIRDIQKTKNFKCNGSKTSKKQAGGNRTHTISTRTIGTQTITREINSAINQRNEHINKMRVLNRFLNKL